MGKQLLLKCGGNDIWLSTPREPPVVICVEAAAPACGGHWTFCEPCACRRASEAERLSTEAEG